MEFPGHDLAIAGDIGWADPVVQGIWTDLDVLFQTWTPSPVTGVYWDITPHLRFHSPIVLSDEADCSPQELSAEENLDLEYRAGALMDWCMDSKPDTDMLYPEIEFHED